MLGIAADQGAGEGDDLSARGCQGTGRVALGGVRAFLFVDFVQDQVLEEVPQVPLDEQGGLVAPQFAGHLPEGRTAAFDQAIAVFLLRVVRCRDGSSAPIRTSTRRFQRPVPACPFCGWLAKLKRLPFFIDQTQAALRAAEEAVVLRLDVERRPAAISGTQLGPVAGDDVPFDMRWASSLGPGAAGSSSFRSG